MSFFRSRVAPANNGSRNGWKNLGKTTNSGLAIEYTRGLFGTKYRTKNGKTPVYKYGNEYSTFNRNVAPIVYRARSKVYSDNAKFSESQIRTLLYKSGLGGAIPSRSGGSNHNASRNEMVKQRQILRKIHNAIEKTGPTNDILRRLVQERLVELGYKI